MQRLPVAVGAVIAALLLVSAYVLDGRRDDSPKVDVVFGEFDGLPESIFEGVEYGATFTIQWTGPLEMHEGTAHVYASRLGDTTEDAPEDGWPLVCSSQYDNVVSQARLDCAFVAPGPGEFALLLEVLSESGESIGETIYTHLVVDPDTTVPDTTVPDTTDPDTTGPTD